MEKKSYFGAYGVILRKEKIVLVKKARGAYKGKLDLPGGGIEHAEKPRETLKREIMEETGLEVLSNTLFDVNSTNIIWYDDVDQYEEYLHHVGIFFMVKAKGRLKRIPDGLDSNGAAWYLIKNLKSINLTPFARYSLEKLGYKIDR